jgi:hypothetical protein
MYPVVNVDVSCKTLPLLRHAAGPERLQLTTARHSEKSAAFPGRQDGPVKGMGF